MNTAAAIIQVDNTSEVTIELDSFDAFTYSQAVAARLGDFTEGEEGLTAHLEWFGNEQETFARCGPVLILVQGPDMTAEYEVMITDELPEGCEPISARLITPELEASVGRALHQYLRDSMQAAAMSVVGASGLDYNVEVDFTTDIATISWAHDGEHFEVSSSIVDSQLMSTSELADEDIADLNEAVCALFAWSW